MIEVARAFDDGSVVALSFDRHAPEIVRLLSVSSSKRTVPNRLSRKPAHGFTI
jgi:hypothetical protein